MNFISWVVSCTHHPDFISAISLLTFVDGWGGYYYHRSFDGLYEAEWARIQNCDFFSNLDTPDVSEEMPEAQKRDLLVEIQSQSGLPASAFGARE